MHRILPDETKQTESEGDHSSEDIPARNSGTGNPPPGVLFTPIHLPANPGGRTGDRLASIWSLKKVFWVIQEVSELGGMGLPSRVAGRQTLMNTSPSRYMNPIPCGVKVNDPGRHHRRRGTGRGRAGDSVRFATLRYASVGRGAPRRPPPGRLHLSREQTICP